jgi:hypothetical protein
VRPALPLCAAALGCLACAGARLTPAQEELRRGGDCAALLREADRARAAGDGSVARALAESCAQPRLDLLVAAATPAEALLWCGRAAAASPRGKPSCDYKRVATLKEALRPHLTVGPPDASDTPDPLLLEAVAQLGPELSISFSPDPDVIVGKLEVEIEHQTTAALVPQVDGKGKRRQVPATNHRIVARARGQLELQEKTRTLRATYEVRDTTWEAVPRWQIVARTGPRVPPEEELRKQAAAAWLKAAARALWLSPPESVDVDDAKGCVAYGLALNGESGDPEAAAHRRGDEEKLDACERLLAEPSGAGIPVP